MKKVAILCLALVLALGSLGVGFALWSETLYINGSVSTGEVNACMSAGDSWDSEPAEKDVSSITCYLDPEDDKTLIVEIVNAYPCIDYYQNFDITNTGTIPIKVQSFTPDQGLPPLSTVEMTVIAPGTQIEPGDSVYGTIHIHLENDADELATYTFGAEILVVQWNEYVPVLP